MSPRHRHTRSIAVLTALLIALTALPAVAGARPTYDGPGDALADAGAPAPTVVHTTVREDANSTLPIALAGAALIVAIAGSGYAVLRVAPLRRQLRGQH